MRAMCYKEAQAWLKDNLNIDADISVGNRAFNRPGKPNTYSRNGETISHEDAGDKITFKPHKRGEQRRLPPSLARRGLARCGRAKSTIQKTSCNSHTKR